MPARIRAGCGARRTAAQALPSPGKLARIQQLGGRGGHASPHYSCPLERDGQAHVSHGILLWKVTTREMCTDRSVCHAD